MSKPILDKTSFGILRTNPKLTSNVKLISDSKDRLYLESFSANDELSKSKYKAYKVSSRGDYYFDLYSFYNQGSLTSNEIAFELFQRDNTNSIKELYGLQFDQFYGYGAEPKNSRLYDEEFSLFAPLWLEPSNIPDYFIICRIEDPVSVNTKNSTSEYDQTIYDQIVNPKNFVDNILSKSTIIKSFDLTNQSNLGRYIRKHASNVKFPESAIIANWEKDKYFEYNGINIRRPGFTSKKKELYYETWPNDSTIIEYENKITNGFSELGIVHPNVLNLEFLFDDDNVETYRFQRYFGLYVNKAEYNKFFIDGEALFADRFNQSSQLPLPLVNDIGYKFNIEDQKQTNENGIVVYAEQPPISSIDGSNFFANEIVFDRARIGYCEDASGKFHKIKNSSQFDPGTLRLNDKEVNWKDFSGFQTPDNYVDSEFNLSVKGRPACVIEFTGTPINDDEFRIFFTDPTDPAQLPYIDVFTLTATNTIPIRTSNSNSYSTLGNNEDRAIAFAKCVRERNTYYPDLLSISAVAIGNKVVIFSRISSETWNKIKVTSFSQAVIPDDIAIRFISGLTSEYSSSTYQSSPQPFTPTLGFLAEGQFVGGNNNTKAKVKISNLDTSLFDTDKYLVTNEGYSKILNVIPYLDEPIRDKSGQIIGFDNFDSYYTVNIEDTSQDIILTSSNQCSIVPLRFNSCGLFSMYPIKDFDFDFYNVQYKKDADSNTSKLYDFYLGQTGPFGQTSSFTPGSGLTGPTGWIDSIIGPSSVFVQEGEFYSLMGISNLLADTNSNIYNEYDRLKENEVKELSVDSRVVPFINKWVFDDNGLDVRQNPYRLNADASFRYSNFGPSFREFANNPKFYTHEWFYLQKYPPYMDLEERKKSWSYFNNAINIGSTYASSLSDPNFGLATVDGPTSFDSDYFSEYFTKETIVAGGATYPVSQEVKYSTFAYANDQRYAETLFRGVKVIVKERFENSDINFDINKKRLKKGTKYNDYKFAACLSLTQAGTSYKIIENERYKTITFVIEAGLMDDYFTKFGSGPSGSTDPNDYFIDRTLIYNLRDKVGLTGATYQPVDVELGGALYSWTGPIGNYTLTFGENLQNGTFPDLANQVAQNADGSYNDIIIPRADIPSQAFLIRGIQSVSISTLRCQDLQVVLNTPPSYPNTGANVLTFPYAPQTFATNPALFNPMVATSIYYQVPRYLNGGYRAFEGIIDSLSFASIADSINSGSPNVEYITYKADGTVINNDKVLELSIPNELWKANYLIPVEDRNVPNELDSIITGDVAGYEMSATENADINVLSRYSGRYQPKFNNIFGFLDFENGIIGSTSVNGPRYYGFDNYLNLEFDLESDFGNIPNYFYNKANPENPGGVLKLSNTALPSLYPKIGEIAIDKRDFYTFLSNWDMGYYNKAINRTTEEPIIGYRGVIEQKSFMGSKILSIPDKIRLENWTLIELEDLVGGLANIDNVTETVVKDINVTSTPAPNNTTTEKSELILNVFSSKALIQYLRADGIDTEFNDFINPAFSFGESGLDDDIEEYIKNNIFQRYRVERIVFYENQFANNVNQLEPIELDLSNFELLQKGYKISENLSVKFRTDSPLDFKLIYNIPKLQNYSISFKVDLVKK